MVRPYVSHKKLCDNSRAAMLAAIEIYNKPQTTYREQVVTVLVVNAWELILKAALCKAKRTSSTRRNAARNTYPSQLPGLRVYSFWQRLSGRHHVDTATANRHHAQLRLPLV